MDAIGMIETKGLTGCINASDAMVKTANVQIVKQVQIGGGFVTVIVKGDIGSVKAGIEAGKKAAQSVGEFVGSSVIARPHQDLMAKF